MGGNKQPEKNVNSRVDNPVGLECILKSGGDVLRGLFALQINGRSPVLYQLSKLQSDHPKEYKRLKEVFRLVAQNKQIHEEHVKRGEGRYHGVFEVRAGKCRLFYFECPFSSNVIVCTNHYWKAKDSHQEQNKAFETCLSMRAFYIKHGGPAKKSGSA